MVGRIAGSIDDALIGVEEFEAIEVKSPSPIGDQDKAASMDRCRRGLALWSASPEYCPRNIQMTNIQKAASRAPPQTGPSSYSAIVRKTAGETDKSRHRPQTAGPTRQRTSRNGSEYSVPFRMEGAAEKPGDDRARQDDIHSREPGREWRRGEPDQAVSRPDVRRSPLPPGGAEDVGPDRVTQVEPQEKKGDRKGGGKHRPTNGENRPENVPVTKLPHPQPVHDIVWNRVQRRDEQDRRYHHRSQWISHDVRPLRRVARPACARGGPRAPGRRGNIVRSLFVPVPSPNSAADRTGIILARQSRDEQNKMRRTVFPARDPCYEAR